MTLPLVELDKAEPRGAELGVAAATVLLASRADAATVVASAGRGRELIMVDDRKGE
ncbi:hypothetical protein [Corynebacterium sanguinis]|uniref:hypothetical protein n=1 Tax=Corynebacterium sanguinis TaxID=2594913 RepID=UPI00223BDADB|nr:hypothetical protein [Corynebacterium sanguinis]MCT2158622.1 hypothetical protein [Corynebacterium sanguinis]